MKTARTTVRDAKKNGIEILTAALALCEQNIKGSQGSERLRIQEEIDGIRARLAEIGQPGIRVAA